MQPVQSLTMEPNLPSSPDTGVVSVKHAR